MLVGQEEAMNVVAQCSFFIVILLSLTIAGDANADQQLRCAVRGTSCVTECDIKLAAR